MKKLTYFLFIISSLTNYALGFESNEKFELLKYVKNKKLTFFEYKDSALIIEFNPIVGFSVESIFKHPQRTTTWGFDLKGRLNNRLHFGFQFNDNIVYNSDYYNRIDFINKQGRILTVNRNDRSEFSETTGYLYYENDYLKFGVIKDNLTYGEGRNSKLILSNRAPSFPSFILNLKLADWFSVYSIHGWLISGIEDSSKSYNTNLYRRKVEHEKYFALHSFQFDLWEKLSFRVGETIIYSDRGPYIGYMLPFILFRSLDHNFSYGSEDSGNNGSLFFDGVFNMSKTIKVYGSLFIDELSFSNLLKGNSERNQFAYLIGLNSSKLFFNNLNTSIEYTRILPWVYSNWIPAQTYSNNRFPMGHYIGQNSDQIYLELNYSINSGLNIVLSGDYTRTGGFSDVSNQYNPPGEEFLYGLRRKIFRLGGDLKIKYLENIFMNFEYDFYDVKDEDTARTPNWQLGKNHFISLRIFYGLDR